MRDADEANEQSVKIEGVKAENSTNRQARAEAAHGKGTSVISDMFAENKAENDYSEILEDQSELQEIEKSRMDDDKRSDAMFIANVGDSPDKDNFGPSKPTKTAKGQNHLP